jgi:Fe2+ transport system protein FeoA
VCQTGDPWIVQVRSTRIGIAESVARAILVIPEERA